MTFIQRLAYFPAAFFGMTMGLGGLSLAFLTLANHQAWLFLGLLPLLPQAARNDFSCHQTTKNLPA